MAQQAEAVALRRSRSREANAKVVRRILLYALSVALATMFFFPFFYTIMSSLKEAWEMYTFPPKLFPAKLMWGNYPETWGMVPMGRWFYNTIIVVLLAASGTVLTSSLVAYGFSRFEFRFRDAMFMITLSTMMLPAQVTLIPRFILWFKLGQGTGIAFINTLRPLWIPWWFGGGAFAIFLMRQFIMTIPKDLDEAALIDGASHTRIFWTIVMPLSKPVIATLAIISFIAHWNSFVEPLIYLNDPLKFTVSLGVMYFRRTAGGLLLDKPKEHLLMCASVMATILPVAVFFSFQQYFVRGVVMSGIKG